MRPRDWSACLERMSPLTVTAAILDQCREMLSLIDRLCREASVTIFPVALPFGRSTAGRSHFQVHGVVLGLRHYPSPSGLAHRASDGLPAGVDVHVLDRDLLLALGGAI